MTNIYVERKIRAEILGSFKVLKTYLDSTKLGKLILFAYIGRYYMYMLTQRGTIHPLVSRASP